MKFTLEQLTKAKAAKNAEELLALAKENGMELTEEEAAKYFADLHKEGELSDDELDNVSGGGCGEEPKAPEEYTVKAGWKPVCDGQYRASPDAINRTSLLDNCCGRCAHFQWEGYLSQLTVGVCRREFES